MKVVNNPALRSVFAIVLGLILVLWPAATINYLVIVIGVLFLVPGLIAMIGYLMRDKGVIPMRRSRSKAPEARCSGCG